MNKELSFLLYTTPEENVKIGVVVKEETLWLTQKAMGDLFDVKVPAISKHIKNIYQEGELSEETTISKMETVSKYIKKRRLNYRLPDIRKTILAYNINRG